jgi:hypothetical protein
LSREPFAPGSLKKYPFFFAKIYAKIFVQPNEKYLVKLLKSPEVNSFCNSCPNMCSEEPKLLIVNLNSIGRGDLISYYTISRYAVK